MVRIITIHHETNVFLEIQKRYIERYMTEDYKIYCGVSKFTPHDMGDKYHVIDITSGSIIHADRLNNLIKIAMSESDDDDLLVIMDSDTFPIDTNWVNSIREDLSDNPISAIQRKDNFAAGMGCILELHPHPCFFTTTIKFWRSSGLNFGNVPNTGYNIYEWLGKNNLDFTKILRSNSVNLHPLYFGVYGDIVYHHGSGNRLPYDGIDICSRPRLGCGVEMDLKYPKIPMFNQKLSELVVSEINNDGDFIRNFLMGVK